mgnify:FL=1
MRNHYLFWKDSYERKSSSDIKAIIDQEGIILEKSLFYPTSGGQPCDQGIIEIREQSLKVHNVKKIEGGEVLIIPEFIPQDLKIGEQVKQKIDWDLRYKYMKMHSALHLLSVVIPLPVTGGQIGSIKSRLDFDMPEAIEDKKIIEDKINDLIMSNFVIEQLWISEKELEEKPELVKTMSVSPPKGSGDIRLIRIKSENEQVDLQPCGGTHVNRTSEIGKIEIGKIEKKGKNNRRVNIHLAI